MTTASTDRLAAAIDDGVGRRLPTELCRLTAAYLAEQPHTFEPFAGSVEVQSTTAAETAIVGLVDKSPFGWLTLVSTRTFETGCTRWTVEFKRSSPQNYISQIAVGVTTRSANRGPTTNNNLPFSDLSDRNDWLLFVNRYPDRICKSHNAGSASVDEDVVPRSTATMSRFRFEFVADAATGRIVATILQPDAVDRLNGYTDGRLNGHADGDGRFVAVGPPITLLVASTDVNTDGSPAFASLRPCVAVAGQQSAIVRSGLTS
jgi:hypothetical protein